VRRLPLVTLCLLAFAAHVPAETQQPRGQSHGRLFPPQDLGLLEAPDRDNWQHPDEVMDKLGIADGSVVADIGAGAGWFTIRVARRVGPNGIVYAEDVQQEMLTALTRRATAEQLQNVQPILGKPSDPQLPPGSVNAILLVNSYHEIDDRVTLLRNLAKALKPSGRIGIIDFKLEGSGPGPDPEERVSPETVIADAQEAGLRLLSQESFLPYQYFLIFGAEVSPAPSRKPATPPATRHSR
jgi:predicted methyltransferase